LQTRNFAIVSRIFLRKILAEYTESMPLDWFPVVQKVATGTAPEAYFNHA